jgi:hypothetical protein
LEKERTFAKSDYSTVHAWGFGFFLDEFQLRLALCKKFLPISNGRRQLKKIMLYSVVYSISSTIPQPKNPSWPPPFLSLGLFFISVWQVEALAILASIGWGS